jgi:branched-chain amino acid transport system permease protein
MKQSHLMVAGAVMVLSLLVPFAIGSDYTLQVLFRIYLFSALGLAWNLVGGYTGQLSLGHAAYFGAGAYGLAMAGRFGLPAWPGVAVGVGIALLLALLIGGISFRLRGPYFALATIACAEIVRLTTKNLGAFTGGDVGIQVPALFQGNVTRSFYWAAVLLAAVSLGVTVLITRSRFGYYLLAIREDEDTALSVGIATAKTKLMALLVSAALSAVAGSLYASLFLYIVPDQVMGHDISNEVAIVAMLGGGGTLVGPIVGSVILETASEVFKNAFQEAHLLIYGGLLVFVVLFLPEGIVGTLVGRRKAGASRPSARKAA